MAAGQALVIIAAQTADRNFWASTRELEEDELVGYWAGYGWPMVCSKRSLWFWGSSQKSEAQKLWVLL